MILDLWNWRHHPNFRNHSHTLRHPPLNATVRTADLILPHGVTQNVAVSENVGNEIAAIIVVTHVLNRPTTVIVSRSIIISLSARLERSKVGLYSRRFRRPRHRYHYL